jgi:hypothetical protein
MEVWQVERGGPDEGYETNIWGNVEMKCAVNTFTKRKESADKKVKQCILRAPTSLHRSSFLGRSAVAEHTRASYTGRLYMKMFHNTLDKF